MHTMHHHHNLGAISSDGAKHASGLIDKVPCLNEENVFMSTKHNLSCKLGAANKSHYRDHGNFIVPMVGHPSLSSLSRKVGEISFSTSVRHIARTNKGSSMKCWQLGPSHMKNARKLVTRKLQHHMLEVLASTRFIDYVHETLDRVTLGTFLS